MTPERTSSMITDTIRPPAETADGVRASAAPLSLTRLSKRYGEVDAVRDVDLHVEPGEFLTLLGPSGSGKSTTLAMVAGFETPTSGTITLGGTDITYAPTHKRDLGMVFQGYALFPHLSVFENVAFPLGLRRVPRAEIRQRVHAALETVSLGAFADRRPAALSGGQQQRVALARAFVHRPRILLMDEPLSALDKSLRTQMQQELRQLHEALGMTVLFVTHDQEEALSLSDRIVVMNAGSIVQSGTPADIYENPTTEFVAGFLGSATFIEGTVSSYGAEPGSASLAVDGGTLIGRCTAASTAFARAPAVLRPEDASIVRPTEPANVVRVRVLSQVYLGERIQCVVAFPGGVEGTFWLDHRDAAQVVVGTEIDLYWPHARTVFVS